MRDKFVSEILIRAKEGTRSVYQSRSFRLNGDVDKSIEITSDRDEKFFSSNDWSSFVLTNLDKRRC